MGHLAWSPPLAFNPPLPTHPTSRLSDLLTQLPQSHQDAKCRLWAPPHFSRLDSESQADQTKNLCFQMFPQPSLVAQRVKCLPAMQETRVQSLGWEDPLEKEMAPHSSTLAWKIPWTEEPGGLQSMGSQRVGQHTKSQTRWSDFTSTFFPAACDPFYLKPPVLG